METQEQIKEMVRQKYSEIALKDKESNEASCCGSGCCTTEVYNIMSDDYTNLKGYNPDADLGLGCGLPTRFAQIKKGDTVIDLGSGAGNDAFIARSETGETGKVIGIDFTDAMIDKARSNAEKLRFHNVEFRKGDIEKMPVTANTADVIVSNCRVVAARRQRRLGHEEPRVGDILHGGHRVGLPRHGQTAHRLVGEVVDHRLGAERVEHRRDGLAVERTREAQREEARHQLPSRRARQSRNKAWNSGHSSSCPRSRSVSTFTR